MLAIGKVLKGATLFIQHENHQYLGLSSNKIYLLFINTINLKWPTLALIK
jgi:hypothetical protein